MFISHTFYAEGKFEECAFNETCARRCVVNYMNKKRTESCGGDERGARTCFDYGVIHSNPSGCKGRDWLFVQVYETLLVKKCGLTRPKTEGTVRDHANLSYYSDI